MLKYIKSLIVVNAIYIDRNMNTKAYTLTLHSNNSHRFQSSVIKPEQLSQ